MAPRNDGKEGANGSDEPKAEKGHATMATLRYDTIMDILMIPMNFESLTVVAESVRKLWSKR